MYEYITFPILFWLFFLASILGVLIEGLFCLIRRKRWETHTVAIWGPFCIIYGMGAAGLYVSAIIFENFCWITQFLLYAVVSAFIEHLCGLVLKYGLGMKAWDYSNMRLNLHGLTCLRMTLAWGLIGVGFAYFGVPLLKIWSLSLRYSPHSWITKVLAVFMGINLSMTFLCILRWSRRHRGIPAKSKLDYYLDKKYDDDKMSRRFCEWKFLEETI